MIMLWNRREIYCGFSNEQFNRALDDLSAKGIKYRYRIVRTGTIATNIMYYVYVHKRDKEIAKFLVGKS